MARRAEKRRADEAAGLFAERVATKAAALVAAAVGKRIIIGGEGREWLGRGNLLVDASILAPRLAFRRCAAELARTPGDGKTK